MFVGSYWKDLYRVYREPAQEMVLVIQSGTYQKDCFESSGPRQGSYKAGLESM